MSNDFGVNFKIIFLFIILLLVLLIFVISPSFNSLVFVEHSKKTSDISYNISIPNYSCNVTKVLKTVNGHSMTPMITNSQSVIMLKNFYDCNDVMIGDLVAYNYTTLEIPSIKIVKVNDNQKVEIINNSLFINNEVMKNSIGSQYVFSDKEVMMLKLYIQNNKIPKNSFLIFGDNIYSSIDSRKFGAVEKKDFLGKFILE